MPNLGIFIYYFLIFFYFFHFKNECVCDYGHARSTPQAQERWWHDAHGHAKHRTWAYFMLCCREELMEAPWVRQQSTIDRVNEGTVGAKLMEELWAQS